MIAGPFVVTVGDYPATEAELDTGLISGVILDVGLRHTFDGGSSMDIAINTTGEAALTKPILNLTSSNTDGWFAPRDPLVDTDGGTIADQYNQGISVHDRITIAISNAGEGDQLEVWFLMRN